MSLQHASSILPVVNKLHRLMKLPPGFQMIIDYLLRRHVLFQKTEKFHLLPNCENLANLNSSPSACATGHSSVTDLRSTREFFL